MQIDPSQLAARLQNEPVALSFAKLKKAFVNKKVGILEADLRTALNAALIARSVYAWPKNSYWHLDPEAQLHTEILNSCAAIAHKRTAIKVKGRTPKDVAAAVDRLLDQKKLLRYPALSGTAVLLVTATVPRAYWAYVEAFVKEKLKKAGIEEAALDEEIWEHLVRLEPDKDVPVSVVRLRKALSHADKQRFDEAALKLREQRRVHLSLHDDPHGLSAEDREGLIDGKGGRYYVAITRRQP